MCGGAGHSLHRGSRLKGEWYLDSSPCSAQAVSGHSHPEGCVPSLSHKAAMWVTSIECLGRQPDTVPNVLDWLTFLCGFVRLKLFSSLL